MSPNLKIKQQISASMSKIPVKIESNMCLTYWCVNIVHFLEDDTEISFEPGDIIRDVETVDKAWWSGFSKDGRKGLFPANYVEAI